ncbi:MAG: spermine/spermidine synthase domain-containing protein [Syntrophales bacterium]
MIPWQLLESTPIPGKKEDLRLYRRGAEFSIRVDGAELMNSRIHGSEEALAEFACARIGSRPAPRVLIGGLGMGYTLAAALKRLGADSRVVVAELVPTVVAWNRGPLAALAGRPLDDGRVTVRECDVAELLRAEHQAYDAIVLDVDNGPRGLTRKSNGWLYTRAGLDAVVTALRPAGVFTLWSATPGPYFTRLLGKAGFEVDVKRVRARSSRRGGYHTIWIAGRAA